MTHPIIEVHKLGQSIWYDCIARSMITSGELSQLVQEDGLLGMTSNPAIFENALGGSTDYDQATKALVRQNVGDAKAIYEHLAIDDIRFAADLLYPAYERTNGTDGYISMEVSPYLANDTQSTIEEARRLHFEIGRDNVMIKVPATPAGVPAIRQLISEGICINVTLLFSVDAYHSVAMAYLDGLEQYVSQGGSAKRLSSVASFFISRIDSLVDKKLKQANHDFSEDLRSTIAIANAKIAYGKYLAIVESDRWKKLASQGARPQRLLWASTSTKDPILPTTYYVDALIGPDTVNTMPESTYVAFQKEGTFKSALTDDWKQSHKQAEEKLERLAVTGISLESATDQLVGEGVQKFADAFDKLLAAVERKRQKLIGSTLNSLSVSLNSHQEFFDSTLEQWRSEGTIRRLWNKDASLWSSGDEASWLGWLKIIDQQMAESDELLSLAQSIKTSDFDSVLLLGMGGSSLCPEVIEKTFGRLDGFPKLVVLDSTVPAQVRSVTDQINPERTLFIVSSKSGGTTETKVLRQYFFELVSDKVGEDRAGQRFVTVTDPGTQLWELAEEQGFLHIFEGVPDIGGRYSALSHFGMVPIAAMGVDPVQFLLLSEEMQQACSPSSPPETNPGLQLGLAMGNLAMNGIDKVTFVVSPVIQSLGAWLEQLIAESTGKHGNGVIPIDGETLGSPDVYSKDRLFVYIRHPGSANESQDNGIKQLQAAGFPVVQIEVSDPMQLGQEFYRWEIATAVCGSVLKINPFNQPDVESAKIATRKITAAFEESGEVAEESPFLDSGGIKLFANAKNCEAIIGQADNESLEAAIKAHLNRLEPNDYLAINAYLEMDQENDECLQGIRLAIRDSKKVATTLGYGPRFLHSTGQLHKGGPNTGVFLQITSDDADDLAIPGQKYSFGQLKSFQAQGDLEVLAERDRRVLRIHLEADVAQSLGILRAIVDELVR